MGYQKRRGYNCRQIIVGLLVFCYVINIESAHAELTITGCDINGDRDVGIADAVLGLQVLSGFPVSGLSVPAGEEIDLEEIICALQIQAGARSFDTTLVDWDGDGFNEFSGDCNESDPDINPGQPEICGDETDNNCNGETDEGCSETVTTPAGQNVGITVLGFDFVFDSVSAGGETTVQFLPSAPVPPPIGFLFAGINYDVSTTAQFTGAVQICINYDDTGLGAEQEAGLQIFHYNENTSQWENITTTPADTGINRVCGETTSFSPVALGFSSIVGRWTVWMDYYCNGGDYTLTWIFSSNGSFTAVLPNGQTDYGTWTWNSIGISYTVTLGTFPIPGSISGNTIGGSYTGSGGVPVCYSGVRQ